METILTLLLLYRLTKNKYFALLSAFIFGIAVDYLNFEPIGQSASILVALFLLLFLYEQKFFSKNILFQLVSFNLLAAPYGILSRNLNLAKFFWFNVIYLTIIIIFSEIKHLIKSC